MNEKSDEILRNSASKLTPLERSDLYLDYRTVKSSIHVAMYIGGGNI